MGKKRKIGRNGWGISFQILGISIEKMQLELYVFTILGILACTVLTVRTCYDQKPTIPYKPSIQFLFLDL